MGYNCYIGVDFFAMAFAIEKYHFKTDYFLKDLGIVEKKLIKKGMKRLELRKNEILFKEGEYSKGAYIIKKGTIKIFQFGKDGKEQIVYIYTKNELMGYRPLLCDETHPVTAVAIEDCELLFIPYKVFLGVLDKSLKLCRRIHENLAHEFNVWINTITVLAQQPVTQRLAIVLLILNEKFRKKPDEERPVINLTRMDMASYARITIETLARTLGHFRERGIIKTEGRKITILQPRKLIDLLN